MAAAARAQLQEARAATGRVEQHHRPGEREQQHAPRSAGRDYGRGAGGPPASLAMPLKGRELQRVFGKVGWTSIDNSY